MDDLDVFDEAELELEEAQATSGYVQDETNYGPGQEPEGTFEEDQLKAYESLDGELQHECACGGNCQTPPDISWTEVAVDMIQMNQVLAILLQDVDDLKRMLAETGWVPDKPWIRPDNS